VKIIQAVDDLHMAEDGREVKATETRLVGLGSKRVELDLTAEHAEQLDKLLAPYLAAGHRPEPKPPSPGVAASAHAKMSRAEAADLRAWADAQTPPLPYKKAESSGPYYSIRLRRLWAAHKEAEGLVYD
jgi:hypothetical protein